jgi:protein SCO1/2
MAAVAGCGAPAPAPAPPPAASKPATPSEATDRYTLVGVVRNVDPKAGVVTIRHEAIPGFMEAMTMPFTLEDRDELDDLRPGDEVEGTLLVVKEHGEVKDYELKDLVVTGRAAPTSLTLSLSGGQPALTRTPQVLRPGDPVPDFEMTTQEGKSLKLSDLRGKVVALTFIYTRCPLPDFCPLMDKKFQQMSGMIAAVPGRAEHVRLLSVSFDPEHDTPEVLRKHAMMRGATPPLWTFVVAGHEELAKVALPLGLAYGPSGGEYVHNLSTAVIDPEGRLARLETGPTGKTWTPTDLLKAMYSRIPDAKK